MDFKEYFNTYKAPNAFAKKGDKIKGQFRKNLTLLKTIIEEGWDDENNTEYDKSWCVSTFGRLMLGYNGASYGSGIVSGAYTNEWKRKKDANKSYKGTADHVGGTTAVGEYIVKVFKENNLDIDYMVDKWLSENLYLWATVKVTGEEHNKKNILQNSDMPIEDKFKFYHYVDTSDITLPYKDEDGDECFESIPSGSLENICDNFGLDDSNMITWDSGDGADENIIEFIENMHELEIENSDEEERKEIQEEIKNGDHWMSTVEDFKTTYNRYGAYYFYHDEVAESISNHQNYY